MKSRAAIQNEPFKPHALKVAEAMRDRVFNKGDEEDDTDPEGRRLAEIHQWKNQVVDLHRVLSVSQAMFLLLEHNNEALLRVAIEIVTCPVCQKVLWWDERWYYDDEQREWFRKQVFGKLAQIMQGLGTQMPIDEEPDEDDPRLEELTKLREEAENARNAALKAQQAAEHQLREAEEALRESKGHTKELEKSMEGMRKEIKEHMAARDSAKPAAPDVREDLVAAQQQIKLGEEQKKKMEDKLTKALEELNRSASKADLEKAEGAQARLTTQLGEEKGKVKDLESEVRKLKSLLEMEQNKPKDKPPPPPKKEAPVKTQVVEKVVEKVVVDHSAEEGLAAARDSLLEEQRRAQEIRDEAERLRHAQEEEHAKVSQLEEDNGTLKRQVGSLEDDILDLKSKLAHALAQLGKLEEDNSGLKRQVGKLKEDNSKAQAVKEVVEEPTPVKPKPKPEPVEEPPPVREPPPKVETPPPEPPKPAPKPRPTGIPEEEHLKILEKLERAKEKIAEMREEITALKQERDGYESKQGKLLKMLHTIKEQLKRMTEIAEKKGFGNVVTSILEESNVSQTLDSPEYTAFDRLYDDARRRAERQRLIQEERLGMRPSTELQAFDRRQSRIGMQQMNIGAGMAAALGPAPSDGRRMSAAGDPGAIHLKNRAMQRAARIKSVRKKLALVAGGRGGSHADGVSSVPEGQEGLEEELGSSSATDDDDDDDGDYGGPILCERCGMALGTPDDSSASSWAQNGAAAGNLWNGGLSRNSLVSVGGNGERRGSNADRQSVVFSVGGHGGMYNWPQGMPQSVLQEPSLSRGVPQLEQARVQAQVNAAGAGVEHHWKLGRPLSPEPNRRPGSAGGFQSALRPDSGTRRSMKSPPAGAPWQHAGGSQGNLEMVAGSHPASELGRPASEFGRSASEFGRPASEFGRPASEFGRPASELGRASGELGRASGEAGSLRAHSTGARASQSAPQGDRGSLHILDIKFAGPAAHVFGVNLVQIRGQSTRDGSSASSTNGEEQLPSNAARRKTTPALLAGQEGQREPRRSLSPSRKSVSARSPSPLGHVEAAVSLSSQLGHRPPITFSAGHAAPMRSPSPLSHQEPSLGISGQKRASAQRSPSPVEQDASGRSESPIGDVGAAIKISSQSGQTATVRSSSPSSQTEPISSVGPGNGYQFGRPGLTAPARSGVQEGKLRRNNSQPHFRRGGPTGDEAGVSKQQSMGVMKPGLTIQGKGQDDRGDSRRDFHRQMPDVILGPVALSSDKRSNAARPLSTSHALVSGRGPQGMSSTQSSPSMAGDGHVSAMELDLHLQGSPTGPTREPKRRLYRSRSIGGISSNSMSKREELPDDAHSDVGDGMKSGTRRRGPRGKKLHPPVTAMFHPLEGAGPKKPMWKDRDVEKQIWQKHKEEKQVLKSAPNLLSLGHTTYLYAGGCRPIPTTELTPGWGTGWETVPAKEASDFPPAQVL